MLKIGHRGAKAYALENTLTSFRKALELGVDMVEFDVRLTKDRYPVVIHDRQLARLGKDKKFIRVNQLTLREIKKIKIKHGERIPTLGEVLNAIENKVGMDIELKVKDSAQIVVQTLREHQIDFSNVMVSTNFAKELRMAEEMEPEITTALVFRSGNSLSIWLILDFLAVLFLPFTVHYISWLVKRANANYLNINHRFLNKKKVDIFHAKGIKICAWTVDNINKINYLKSLGVDGIITNYPDRL